MQSSPENRSRGRSQSRGRTRLSSPPRFKFHGMIFGDLDPVKYDSSDPPSRACFNCWSVEHKRKNCTQPKTYDYCCNCGRSEITVKNCPRCARAFHDLNDDLKEWIYEVIYENFDGIWNDDRKQMMTMNKEKSEEDENWDRYDEDGSKNRCLNNQNFATKDDKLNDEDSEWEPTKSYQSQETDYVEDYEEPNNLFDYLSVKKTIDEFNSDAMKNKVNLDDTRMAERDSLADNSIMSVDEALQKDEKVVCSTGDPIQDFLNLLYSMKHLSIETQNAFVLQYIAERKYQMAKKKEV